MRRFFYLLQLVFHVPSPFVVWRNMTGSVSEEMEFIIFPNFVICTKIVQFIYWVNSGE